MTGGIHRIKTTKMIFIVAIVTVVLSSILNFLGYFGEDWFDSKRVPIDNSQPTVTQTTSGDTVLRFLVQKAM